MCIFGVFFYIFLKTVSACTSGHALRSEPTHRAQSPHTAAERRPERAPAAASHPFPVSLSVTQQTHTTCFACARSRDGSEAGDADEVDAVAVTVRVGQVMPQVRPIHALCLAIAVNAHV